MTFSLGKLAKKTFSKYKARAKAKIKRLEKKGFNVKDYLNFDVNPTFNNRKEYNQWKRNVDNFTNRNNSDFKVKKNKFNVDYLGIEKKILDQSTKVAIQKAKDKQNEINDLPIYDHEGNLVGRVGEDRKVLKDEEVGFVRQPTEITIDQLPTRSVIDKRIKQMQERSDDSYFDKRNNQMRENWVELMRISFGEDADELVDKVRSMNINDFVELFWMFRDFKFEWYDSQKGYLGDNNNEQLEELNKSVDMYLKGVVDKDLTRFN